MNEFNEKRRRGGTRGKVFWEFEFLPPYLFLFVLLHGLHFSSFRLGSICIRASFLAAGFITRRIGVVGGIRWIHGIGYDDCKLYYLLSGLAMLYHLQTTMSGNAVPSWSIRI
jgi:hypothetical protein